MDIEVKNMFLESLSYILLVLMCVLGTATAIQWITVKLVTPKKGSKAILVLPLMGECAEVEMLLKSAEVRANLMGTKLCDRIVAVDYGLDEETRSACERICSAMGAVKLIEPDELCVQIESIGEGT